MNLPGHRSGIQMLYWLVEQALLQADDRWR